MSKFLKIGIIILVLLTILAIYVNFFHAKLMQPNVLIIALPKSASKYIKTIVGHGLNYEIIPGREWDKPEYGEI